MDKQLETILSSVAVEALQKSDLLCAIPAEADEIRLPGPGVAAIVLFEGDFSGALVMKVPAETLRELAANMLCLDEDDEATLAQQNEALLDTLNVISGNLIPAITRVPSIFSIDPPEILIDGEKLNQESDQEIMSTVKLTLGSGQCDLFLFADNRFSQTPQAMSEQ